MSEIMTKNMLDLMEAMHSHQETPLTPTGEAHFRAIIARLTDYDALKECNEKYWAIMQEQGAEINALKDKYLTATDNLKSREAEVAELTDRHRVDLMELDAQMKSVNAANQNTAKLATEVNNLKAERDEWRDKAGGKP